jgi:uncharacterized phage protein (TIGR01671 family)
MREIKFRAWDGEEIIYYNNWFTLHENTVLCFEESEKHSYVDASDVDYPVRVNLMQFTGLLDKNGKEIYEGDVLDVANFIGENIDRVKVDWGHFGFTMRSEKSPSMLYYAKDLIEVIGNIYESPGLLK